MTPDINKEQPLYTKKLPDLVIKGKNYKRVVKVTALFYETKDTLLLKYLARLANNY